MPAKETREFSHEELEELELDWRTSGGVVKESEVYDRMRWAAVLRIVFAYDGAFWQIDRMDPATEMQEGQDIWDADPVVATRVEPYEVTVTKYRPVLAGQEGNAHHGG